MKIKRFFAKDMRTAIAEVKETLGSNAVIMSNKKVSGGVEIVAAIDSAPPVVKHIESHKERERTLAEDKVRLNKPDDPSKPVFANLLDKYQANIPVRQEQNSEESQLNIFLAKNKKILANKKHTYSQKKQEDKEQFSKRQQDKSSAISQYYRQNQQSSSFKSEQSIINKEIKEVRDEVGMIRDLLQHQLSGLMWQELERKEPLRAMLIKRLQFMGISSQLADQLAGRIPENTSPENAWRDLLGVLGDQIITIDEDILETGGVVALLGPTGVGKTTTIAKLAARAAMDFGADDIALVTTDTFRIGAHEQFVTYGRILGCRVKVAKNADELAQTLYQFRHKKLVFLDTAGLGQRDLRLSEQLDTLMQNIDVKIRSLLVLSATSQRRVLQETIEHFRKIPLSGCVLTKLDECLSLGEVLSVIIEYALPVTFLTTGQRVPEDIRQAKSTYLINKANEFMQQDREHRDHFWNHDMPESDVADFYD